MIRADNNIYSYIMCHEDCKYDFLPFLQWIIPGMFNKISINAIFTHIDISICLIGNDEIRCCLFMVLETKICRSACCEAGLFVEMKRNTRLL